MERTDAKLLFFGGLGYNNILVLGGNNVPLPKDRTVTGVKFLGGGIILFPYICIKHGYWYGSKNPLTSCLIHISQRSHTCRVAEQNQFCVMI